MPAEFNDAPDVEYIAVTIINENHGHLAEAKIKYLFREGPWSSKDRTTWGQAVKVSSRDKHLTGYDFLIIINYKVWCAIDLQQKRALVDHELCHCGRHADDDKEGNPRWYIVGHDLEDFVSVVRRHGYWAESVARMAKAMDLHRQSNLLDHGLEFPEEDEGEAQISAAG